MKRQLKNITALLVTALLVSVATTPVLGFDLADTQLTERSLITPTESLRIFINGHYVPTTANLDVSHRAPSHAQPGQFIVPNLNPMIGIYDNIVYILTNTGSTQRYDFETYRLPMSTNTYARLVNQGTISSSSGIGHTPNNQSMFHFRFALRRTDGRRGGHGMGVAAGEVTTFNQALSVYLHPLVGFHDNGTPQLMERSSQSTPQTVDLWAVSRSTGIGATRDLLGFLTADRTFNIDPAFDMPLGRPTTGIVAISLQNFADAVGGTINFNASEGRIDIFTQ